MARGSSPSDKGRNRRGRDAARPRSEGRTTTDQFMRFAGEDGETSVTATIPTKGQRAENKPNEWNKKRGGVAATVDEETASTVLTREVMQDETKRKAVVAERERLAAVRKEKAEQAKKSKES